MELNNEDIINRIGIITKSIFIEHDLRENRLKAMIWLLQTIEIRGICNINLAEECFLADNKRFEEIVKFVKKYKKELKNNFNNLKLDLKQIKNQLKRLRNLQIIE